MKRIVFFVAIFFATISQILAQTISYCNSVREYVTISSGDTKVTMQKLVKMILDSSVEEEINKNPSQKEEIQLAMTIVHKRVINPYFNSGEFYNDVAGVLTAPLSKEISEAELNEVVAMYKSEDIQQVKTKTSKIAEGLDNIKQEFMQIMTTIRRGGEIPKVEKVNRSKEYRKLFAEYNDAIEAQEKFDEVMAIFKLLKDPKIAKMMDYMQQSVLEISLKRMHDNLTYDELQSYVRFLSNPLVKRCTIVSKGCQEQLGEVIGAKLMDKIQKFSDNPEDGSTTLQDEHKDVQRSASPVEYDSSGPLFETVEEMPSFPGGTAALMHFLSSHVKYPAVAEENGIQGRVFVNFYVEEDGSISEIKVRKGVDPSLDMEAVRLVRSMPKWIPGRQNGKPVRVLSFVPVAFRLE